MADNEVEFSIDDEISTLDNLTAYQRVLETLDAALGAALTPHLTALASGHSFDKAVILGALYAATDTPDLTASEPTEASAPESGT